MMDNIHQPVVFSYFLNELGALAALSIDPLPLAPDSKCLFAPSSEADFFDDCWCNDFLAWEGTYERKLVYDSMR
jgi:hypothetical protein